MPVTENHGQAGDEVVVRYSNGTFVATLYIHMVIELTIMPSAEAQLPDSLK